MKRLLTILLVLAIMLSTLSVAVASERLLEGKTLTYWYPMWAWESEFVGTGDMSDLYAYRELEEELGVTIDWILPPVDNAAAIAALNVLFASPDLPDIVTHPYYTYYPAGNDAAIDDGVYIDLKPYLEEYAPDYWAIVSEDPELVKQMTTDKGRIWCFYMIDSFAQPSYGGPVWREDYIKAVGGEVPITVEQMHDLLLKFKNELHIERPMYGDGSSFLPFAWGVHNNFQQDDNGIVSFGPALDGWREYLRTMNAWYNEGLLAEDFVAPPELKPTFIAGEIGLAHLGFNNITEYTSLARAAENSEFEMIAAPYPKLNPDDTLKLKSVFAYRAQQNCTAITTACKDPIAAVQFLNAKFTEDNIVKTNYGEEGVSFTYVDGKPTYTEALIHPTEPGYTLGILLYKYALGKGPYYRIMDRNWFTHLPHAIDAMYLWEGSTDGGSWGIPEPFLSTPPEEGERLSAIMADVTSYVSECKVKFINGEMSIENDWTTYIETLERMGLKEAIEIKQASFDRYKAR
ncbi:MAG: hypothetical protein ACOX7B_06850 [Christensenellales bacterium]|jgi:putative aldouronate transport system substrate-binding protein